MTESRYAGAFRMVAALALLTTIALPACDDDDDEDLNDRNAPGASCSGGTCPCTPGGCACSAENCDVGCTGAGCGSDCNGGTCRIDCNDSQACGTNCTAGANCSVNCDRALQCSVTCQGGSSCNVDCGQTPICVLSCPDGARCSCRNCLLPARAGLPRSNVVKGFVPAAAADSNGRQSGRKLGREPGAHGHCAAVFFAIG